MEIDSPRLDHPFALSELCCGASDADSLSPRKMALLGAMIALGISSASARTLRIEPGPDAVRLAQSAVMSDPSITAVVLTPGWYRLGAPVEIRGPGRPIVWRSGGRGGAVLDGGGATVTALIVSGRDVTINGLEIRDFTQNGIVVTNADHVTIVDNHIVGIASTAGSQGAIRGLVRATHVVVARNVIEHSGYAGIMFETNARGDLSNLTITGNRVIDSCRVNPDCGAIYINGRSRRNGGTLIEDNIVRDFGPAANATKGIYLDDGLSGAVVRGNDVSGTGTYALQIHGGSDNLGGRNRFAPLGRFMLYQSLADADRPMHGNVIRGNRLSTTDVTYSGAWADRPDLTSNRPIR